MYILIEVIEREISTPSIFPNHKDAQDEMLKRYVQCNNGECGEFGKDYAYCENRNHDNCDWKIFKI